MSVPISTKRTALLAAASERILVLDGAMGTMIQGLEYDEAAFRGERFKDFHRDLRGNNDLLILTQPKAIEDIHADYLRAGADIVATNTFSSTSIAQAAYDLSGRIQPRLPRRDFRRPAHRLWRADQRLAGWRRRPAAAGDDLRYAQCQ